jgi:hypothetical protein
LGTRRNEFASKGIVEFEENLRILAKFRRIWRKCAILLPLAMRLRSIAHPFDDPRGRAARAAEILAWRPPPLFGNFLLDPPRAALLHFLTRIISEMSVLRRAHEVRLSNLDAPLEPEPQARQRAPDQFFAENSKGDE